MKKLLILTCFFLTLNSFTGVGNAATTETTTALKVFCDEKGREFIPDREITDVFGVANKDVLGGISITGLNGANKNFHVGKNDYYLFNVAKSAHFIRNKVNICVDNTFSNMGPYDHLIGIEYK
ncbi:hypothetical protein [Morganella morganii]|uniref:hypothetical protein n=1 Tax=Morganella morganii TaxID=582 RepID=UPI001BD95CAD|nr:hypothetical protein [Morganella morganii]MBT0395646.1 hypothetical protein [Morganella morganii subsp. morganii]MBT0460414.1 hypothetical protein [Morganella morganii subsp. morganii]MDR5686750.1 hypothetical protein [Morganella morganii]